MSVRSMQDTASLAALASASIASEISPSGATIFQDKYFRERQLHSKEDVRKSFALRYEVYCEEREFLAVSDYPEKFETDAYDERSLHFGSFNDEDEIVGTVRLVRGHIDDLPVTGHCTLTPDRHEALRGTPNLHEVSRLAVNRRYRRRRDDGLYGLSAAPMLSDSANVDPRRTTIPTVLRLYRVMYHTLKSDGIDHLIASMEESLFRILRGLRFPFREVGPVSDYYGPVRPYYINISELDEQLSREKPEILAYLASGSCAL